MGGGEGSICPSVSSTGGGEWLRGPRTVGREGITVLAHANCTPFFSPKHLYFVTEKKSFFCHLENTLFQTLPKNAFFISFAHFLLFLGGSNNHSLVQNQRVHRQFSPKKNLLANLKNTNFLIVWKTIKDWRRSHILHMST